MRQICSWRLGPCITRPLYKCSQRCQETWGFPRGLFTEAALLEKETERAWGKALAAEGRYPADLAFVCRCSEWSVRWQLIFFFHQVWIWADSLACSPVCSEQCEFQQVLSLKDFFFLEEKVVWLFGHEEQLVFFPALTPCFKSGATTLSWRSNCRTHTCCSELYLAWCGHSGPCELWCPAPEKVARHGEHSCVSANIICRSVTSPSLSGLKVPPLSLGQYFCNLLFTVIEVKIWQCI